MLRSNLLLRGALTLLAASAALLAQNKSEAVQFSATIYGSYDYNFDGTGAWTGFALVAIGNSPAKVARFVDRNTSKGRRENGSLYGTETISLRFNDGSGTLEIQASFEGIPASTPNLYYLLEVGLIVNGTGDFAKASGHVMVQGPFLFPNLNTTPGAPPWIAEMHGAITGLTR